MILDATLADPAVGRVTQNGASVGAPGSFGSGSGTAGLTSSPGPPGPQVVNPHRILALRYDVDADATYMVTQGAHGLTNGTDIILTGCGSLDGPHTVGIVTPPYVANIAAGDATGDPVNGFWALA